MSFNVHVHIKGAIVLQAGQLLQGRYRLVRTLGENQQRQTWLAIDESTEPGNQVVVKLLSFANAVDWQMLKLFEREASILQQLAHPRIPAYCDYFSINDQHHWFGLVETYIPGKTLKELLESSRRFSEDEIRNIAIEVLEILQYLHQLNPPIYHRDIKPSNLIWGDDERIHLVDFGGVQDKAPAIGSTFTVVGTYGYTPIEQFGGRTIPSSDLYALGATLLHLLTGVPPADLPQKNLRFDFKLLVNLSPKLVGWLDKLIEPDAQNRFPTAEEALQVLNTTAPAHSLGRERYQVKQPRAISQPPAISRVRLLRTDTQLKIELKPPFEVSKPVALIGLGAFALIFVTFLPLAIIAIVIAYTSISMERGYSAICCEDGKLTLYRHFPGVPQFKWDKKALSIDSVQDVIHHNLNFTSGKSVGRTRVITIRTMNREWVFGRSLTLEEGDWLVAELKSWLSL